MQFNYNSNFEASLYKTESAINASSGFEDFVSSGRYLKAQVQV